MNTRRPLNRQTISRTRHASTALPGLLPRAVRRGRAGGRANSRTNGRDPFNPSSPAAAAEAPQGNILQVSQPGGLAYVNVPPFISVLRCTFEAWIQTTVKTQQTILVSISENTGAPQISVENDQIRVQWGGADFSNRPLDTTPITDGQWHHIAVVFEGKDDVLGPTGSVFIYKDGVATDAIIAVDINPNMLFMPGPLQLGAAFGTAGGFVGSFYDVRVWSTPRDPAQIQTQRYANLTGTEAGLRVLTRFNRLHSGTVNKVDGTGGSIQNSQITWSALPSAPTCALLMTGDGSDYGDLNAIAPVTSQSATFECWIQMSPADGVSATPQTLLLCNGIIDGEYQVAAPRIEYDGGDKLGVFWKTPGAYSQDTQPISDGQWHHIAVVFDNNTVTFYKDGLPTGEALTLAQSQTSAPDLQIGSAVGSTHAFNGLIYDVRVWNVPRQATEIQSLMYATLNGGEPGLVALCNFAGCDPAQPATMILQNQGAE